MIERLAHWSRDPRVEPVLRIVGAMAAAIVTAFLLLPILTPVHVEGFTGSVASLAMHLNQDSLANADPQQPQVSEFYSLSKLGWMLLTAATSRLLAISGTSAMAVLTWLAAPALAAGTIFLVRRWTRAPYLLIAAILMLFAGVSESAFFFHDGLVASALAVASFCALYLRARLVGAALCGMLFGAAVLTRTDVVLIGATIPILILERPGSVQEKAASMAVGGAAGAIVLLGTLAAFHSSPLDILTVASAALQDWNRPTYAQYVAWLVAYFLSPVGVLLVLWGVAVVVRQRESWATARLVLVPAIYLLVLLDRTWEIRQLLPLTPFFAALAAQAVQDLLARRHTAQGSGALTFLAVLLLYSLFGPRTIPDVLDGPRVLFGRVANIGEWRSWQRNVRADLDLIGGLTAVPEGATRVIITEQWDPDRYTHLLLQEEGYRVAEVPEGPCRMLADRYVSGAREVYVLRPLVRLHRKQGPFYARIADARMRRWGIACMQALRPTDVVMLATQDRIIGLIDPVAGKEKISRILAAERNHYWPLQAVKVEAVESDPILRGYRRQALKEEKRGPKAPPHDESALTSPKLTNFGF